MSLYNTAASTPYRVTGCNVMSAARRGCLIASKMLPSPRIARYSGKLLPAWRMNHTGVWVVRLPEAAARNGLSSVSCAAGLMPRNAIASVISVDELSAVCVQGHASVMPQVSPLWCQQADESKWRALAEVACLFELHVCPHCAAH